MREQRLAAADAARAFENCVAQIRDLEAELEQCRRTVEFAAERLSRAKLECMRARESRDLAFARRKRHQAFKPKLVDALFSFGGTYREWRTRDHTYATQLASTEADCEKTAAGVAARLDEDADAAAQRSATERELARLRERVRKFERENGAAWPESNEARERSSPWFDENWNRARTSVFINALHLHRAFIECSSLSFRGNMWAAMDLLAGKMPTGLDRASAQSAWATMFFVIPVISTTFASFPRLFRQLGRESLGWLLIDEAGQTTPQAAIGAVWRSKRVVATGDPLQLEPIVNLPHTAQATLGNHFGVSGAWAPSGSSAQQIIDRASRYGTYLYSMVEDRSVWVGCPLRVHRRCEHPMFDISNEIAYDGQMVYATPTQPALPLEPSRWINVTSDIAEDHWVPDEGLCLSFLLADLLAAGQPPDSILLITPFRAVAVELRRIARKFGIKRAGTIHVAQGVESEVVILVLGSNPASDGAREWASERPNLLNVAVSRARRRLYIIGDRARWQHLPHFSQAARSLREKTIGASV